MSVPEPKLKLRIAPDPILMEVCKSAAVFDADLQRLGRAMLRLLPRKGAIGLAAPQVGFPIRLFVVGFNGGLVFVNPEIEVLDWTPVIIQEGCLSLPGQKIAVSRAKHLRVKAHDTHGNALTYEAKDFQSIVIQHELDHLDGILMSDRVARRSTLPPAEGE